MAANKEALREAKDAVKAFPFEWPSPYMYIMPNDLYDISEMSDELRGPTIKKINIKVNSVPVPRFSPHLADVMQPALRAHQDASYPSPEDTMELFLKRMDSGAVRKYGQSKEKLCKGINYYAEVKNALSTERGESCGRSPSFKHNVRENHKVFGDAVYQWKPGKKTTTAGGGGDEQAGRWQLVVPYEEVHRILCWAHGSCKPGERHAGRDKMFELLSFFFNTSNFERKEIITGWLQKCRGCAGKGNGRRSKEQSVTPPVEEETIDYQEQEPEPQQEQGVSEDDLEAFLTAYNNDHSQQPPSPSPQSQEFPQEPQLPLQQPTEWLPQEPQLFTPMELPYRPREPQLPYQEAPQPSLGEELPLQQAWQPPYIDPQELMLMPADPFAYPPEQGFDLDLNYFLNDGLYVDGGSF